MNESLSRYQTLPFPFPKAYVELTKKEAASGFASFLEQRERRMESFIEYMMITRSIRLSRKSRLEDLDSLPQAIHMVGGVRPFSQREQESRTRAFAANLRALARSILPKSEPDEQTLALCFDGGVLWGEVFLRQFPAASWALGSPPKLSFNFQQPLIVGVDPSRSEFNPIREMIAIQVDLMLGNEEPWTLSELSETRALNMGLV